MRSDEQDPKAPRPTHSSLGRSFGGGMRVISPNEEDPKMRPRPLRSAKKGTNALEMIEQHGRTTVQNDDLDRHLHV